jgi:hypothetical protein
LAFDLFPSTLSPANLLHFKAWPTAGQPDKDQDSYLSLLQIQFMTLQPTPNFTAKRTILPSFLIEMQRDFDFIVDSPTRLLLLLLDY